MEIVKSPKQRFFDQNYRDKNQLLHLQMQCSKDFLQIAYFDPAAKKIVGFEEFDLGKHDNWNQSVANLRAIFQQADFPKDCKHYSFGIIDQQYTLVPQSLFDEAHAWNYLETDHALAKDGSISIHHFPIDTKEIQIVYAIHVKLEILLDEFFPQIKKLPHTAQLLESLFLYAKEEKELHVHLQQGHFDLMYLKGGELQILNSFPFHNEEDFMYYLLFVMEQLQIDRDTIELKMSGEIEKTSPLFEMAFQYVRHPKIMDRNADISYSAVLNDIKAPFYSNLFNQFLCE